MMPGQVVDKLWQMWLPVQNALNIGTAFLKPDSSTTLTIPSTASLVITVAAYNALTFLMQTSPDEDRHRYMRGKMQTNLIWPLRV